MLQHFVENLVTQTRILFRSVLSRLVPAPGFQHLRRYLIGKEIGHEAGRPRVVVVRAAGLAPRIYAVGAPAYPRRAGQVFLDDGVLDFGVGGLRRASREQPSKAK